MPHRRPVQLDPALYVGPHRIFLTMCTFRRAQLFIDTTTVGTARGELLRIGESYNVEVVAYCFMPDHLHALIEGLGAESDLLKCTKMFRQRSGHSYTALNAGRLWQEGYVDRFLRAEEATIDVVRYIVGNPIRAGLCGDVREYPHQGSSRYTIEELIASLA
jgi:REP-associated tyrosine transposase